LLELGVVSLILSVSHFFVPNSIASNENIRNGKVTLRTTFSFRTPGVEVCNDHRTEEKRQGVRNDKMKKNT
jgi:hypothetical protein